MNFIKNIKDFNDKFDEFENHLIKTINSDKIQSQLKNKNVNCLTNFYYNYLLKFKVDKKIKTITSEEILQFWSDNGDLETDLLKFFKLINQNDLKNIIDSNNYELSVDIIPFDDDLVKPKKELYIIDNLIITRGDNYDA